MSWFIINTRDNITTEFGNSEEAIKFYNETCVDLKNNNCWGIYLERPHGFFNINNR